MVAPQIQCLELDLEDFYTKRSEDSVHLVFTALFGHCKPGMLTKLITMDPECFGFITVEGDETSLDVTLRVGLSDQELDKLFAPIKVLRLTGLFLPWSSLAYHDLVELCLYPTYTRAESGGNPGSIDESELVDILSASPCLRILRFGLSIIRQEEDDTPTSHRVRLPELGVLQVDPTWGYYMFDYIEDIFRLLEPGTKPLHISIRNRAYWSGTEPYPTETGALFTRSNVRQPYLTEVPHLLELLPSLPYLEVLILSEQSSSLQLSPSTLPTQQCTNHEVIHPQLGICFILDCLLALSEVLLLVQACKPQTLILYGNRFYQDRFGEEVDTEEVGRELSAVCSDVRFTDTYPNLAEYQELVPDH
ncbi:hypothetical protein B0J17DRAFT_678225 [Rhizoctonia solani]|nr:hypothetical protein B0J17DRAFT_678225 [Rhizoctonia solani]